MAVAAVAAAGSFVEKEAERQEEESGDGRDPPLIGILRNLVRKLEAWMLLGC